MFGDIYSCNNFSFALNTQLNTVTLHTELWGFFFLNF